VALFGPAWVGSPFLGPLSFLLFHPDLDPFKPAALRWSPKIEWSNLASFSILLRLIIAKENRHGKQRETSVA
jgi:hypothetical protein